MKTYIIQYYFDGNGTARVQAENQDQARELFFNGGVQQNEENEWGENFIIETIKEENYD